MQDNSTFVVHQRQFVIARQVVSLGEDWDYRALPEGYFLSFQKALAVQTYGDVPTQSGKYVLGRRFLSEHGSSPNLGHTDTGRFCVVDWPYVMSDAAGLMGLLFSTGSAETICTSSPALAVQISGASIRNWQPKRTGVNWTPAPGTRVVGFRRLLADQRLDVSRGKVERRPLQLSDTRSETDATAALCTQLVAVARDVSADAGRLMVTLTAGVDSRTVFGALLASGVKFHAVTQYMPGSSETDVRIAADLCERYRVKHEIIHAGDIDQEIPAKCHAHTLSSYRDADNTTLFAQSYYRFLREGDVVLRGGCFETGRRYLSHHFARIPPEQATGATVWRNLDAGDQPTEIRQFFDDWLTWRRANDIGIDLIDALYFDQRVGAWLSSIEQGLDALPGISVQPVNSIVGYRSLLAGDPARRKQAVVQKEAMRLFEPTLLDTPFNPKAITAIVRERLREVVSRVPYLWRLAG